MRSRFATIRQLTTSGGSLMKLVRSSSYDREQKSSTSKKWASSAALNRTCQFRECLGTRSCSQVVVSGTLTRSLISQPAGTVATGCSQSCSGTKILAFWMRTTTSIFSQKRKLALSISFERMIRITRRTRKFPCFSQTARIGKEGPSCALLNSSIGSQSTLISTTRH